MKKVLIRFSYCGNGFLSSYSNNLQQNSTNTVENFLNNNVGDRRSIGETETTVSVFTHKETHALYNSATIKFQKEMRDYEKYGKDHYISHLNKRLLKNSILPIKVFDLQEVNSNFCARNFAEYCNFLFRFSLIPPKDTNVFESTVVSSLKIQDSDVIKKLENTINEVNCLISNSHTLSNIPGYSRNKRSAPAIVIESDLTTESFLSHGDSFNKHQYYSIHIKHLQTKMAPMITDIINGLLAISIEKSQKQDFIEYLISILNLNDTNNQLKPNFDDYLENKNGIFLTYVHHAEEDLNSYVSIVQGS